MPKLQAEMQAPFPPSARSDRASALIYAAGVVLAGAVVMAGTPGRAETAAEHDALGIAGDLEAGRFAAVVARFSPEMATALPPAQLAAVWQGVVAKAGRLRGYGTPRTQDNGGHAVVTVPLELEKASLNLIVSLSGQKVTGLYLRPAEAVVVWAPDPSLDMSRMGEVEVRVGLRQLPGTLTVPRGIEMAPAIVLVHGSGPNDRDETVAANKPFKDLALGLASRGIAVLRYEKRTRVHPGDFGAGAIFTVKEEVIDDACAAIDLLRSRTDIDQSRVVVLGHSLGATLAPRIAECARGLAGVIIAAGATRPLPDIMVEQVEYLAGLAGSLDEAARAQIAELKSQAAKARGAVAGDSSRILNAPAAYWADLNAFDPATAAARLNVPVLVLQGGRDYQVTAKDLARYREVFAGKATATIREFPSLNHLFISGEGPGRPSEYAVPGHVSGEVIESIVSFVSGLGKR